MHIWLSWLDSKEACTYAGPEQSLRPGPSYSRMWSGLKQQMASCVFAAAWTPEAGLSQDRTHRVPGMLLAINSDGERLGCDSRLGLSALLLALLYPPSHAKTCGILSLPLDCLVQRYSWEPGC